MTDKSPAPGAAPYIQGYWARSERLYRPIWHKGHRDKRWVKEWERGWAERDKLNQEDLKHGKSA